MRGQQSKPLCPDGYKGPAYRHIFLLFASSSVPPTVMASPQNLQVIGVTAVLRHVAFDVGEQAWPRPPFHRLSSQDDFGGFGGELHAVFSMRQPEPARSGLWRARHVQRPSASNISYGDRAHASCRDRATLRSPDLRTKASASRAVPQAGQRPRRTRGRPAIALDLGWMRERGRKFLRLLGLLVRAEGDQVPAAAALADQIERGELTRQRERLRRKPVLAVQTSPMLRVKPASAAIRANGSIRRRRNACGAVRRGWWSMHSACQPENIMSKQPALRRLGHFHNALEVDVGVRVRIGVTPGRHVVADRPHEQAELHVIRLVARLVMCSSRQHFQAPQGCGAPWRPTDIRQARP